MFSSLAWLSKSLVLGGCFLELMIFCESSIAAPKAQPFRANSSSPICYVQDGNGVIFDLSQLCQQDDRQKNVALQKLQQTKACPGCSLQGANLTGMKLREANLSNANLRGSQMTNAFLPFSDFRGAMLSNANLTGANLTGANLMGADLSGANLTGADLSGASLEGAKLTQAIMPDGTVHP